jgi:hypothetical protein
MDSVSNQSASFRPVSQGAFGIIRGKSDALTHADGSLSPQSRQVVFSVPIAIEFDSVNFHQNLIVSE